LNQKEQFRWQQFVDFPKSGTAPTKIPHRASIFKKWDGSSRRMEIRSDAYDRYCQKLERRGTEFRLAKTLWTWHVFQTFDRCASIIVGFNSSATETAAGRLKTRDQTTGVENSGKGVYEQTNVTLAVVVQNRLADARGA